MRQRLAVGVHDAKKQRPRNRVAQRVLRAGAVAIAQASAIRRCNSSTSRFPRSETAVWWRRSHETQ